MLLDKFHEMPWYQMSKENKFVYAHLLCRLQNGVTLHCGPFAELNLETFSNVRNLSQYGYGNVVLFLQDVYNFI